MKGTDSLKMIYRQLYEGMLHKDCQLLDRVLDPSFVLIHMTGMQQNKEQFIDAVKDGTLQYYSAVHEKILVSGFGEQAEITGQSRVRAAVFGGAAADWNLQLQLKVHRTAADDWRILEARASVY